MALLSELPLYKVILEAEKKHGEKTHMIIEAVPLDGNEEIVGDDPDEKEFVWYVEFEYQKKIFDTFDTLKKFLLEEAVATGEGPVVEFDQDFEQESSEPIMGTAQVGI